MSTRVRILADSISTAGKRIITFENTYGRPFHSEFMTHGAFSKNAASSRAVPFKKMLKRIQDEPWVPIHWGKNQPGMQADEEIQGSDRADCIQIWLATRDLVIAQALKLEKLGLHKQIINRLLESWMHITILATATDRNNFYWLRYHKAAEPHFQLLAKMMWEAEQASTPRLLKAGEWHTPLVPYEEAVAMGWDAAVKASVARCARVSYFNHDGSTPDLDKDFTFHDTLVGNGHMSPTAHQGQPLENPDQPSGNFRGWHQYRKDLPNENRTMPFTPPT